MKDELMKRLNALAFKVSHPFCYCCYKDAPSGRCLTCGSDDLMRHLPGVAVEYGTEWIIKDLLTELDPANLDERFEDSIRSCYPEETKVGWLTVDTVTTIKEMDPISWKIAKDEWIDQEENEENLISFDCGDNYFEAWQVEKFLEEKEQDLEPQTA